MVIITLIFVMVHPVTAILLVLFYKNSL